MCSPGRPAACLASEGKAKGLAARRRRLATASRMNARTVFSPSSRARTHGDFRCMALAPYSSYSCLDIQSCRLLEGAERRENRPSDPDGEAALGGGGGCQHA
eukprot:scaffold12472_cov163-Isochrysis_galbana.AAC.1